MSIKPTDVNDVNNRRGVKTSTRHQLAAGLVTTPVVHQKHQSIEVGFRLLGSLSVQNLVEILA